MQDPFEGISFNFAFFTVYSLLKFLYSDDVNARCINKRDARP